MNTLICLVLVVSVALVHGAMYQKKLPADPAHPGYCHDKGPPKVLLQAGMSAQHPEECAKQYCRTKNGAYYLTTMTCGIVQGSPECGISADLSKPYPGCCPEINC